jgi:hypothetical protein
MIQKIRFVCWPSDSSFEVDLSVAAPELDEEVSAALGASPVCAADRAGALEDRLACPAGIVAGFAWRQFCADAPAVKIIPRKIAGTILLNKKIHPLWVFISVFASRLAPTIIN